MKCFHNFKYFTERSPRSLYWLFSNICADILKVFVLLSVWDLAQRFVKCIIAVIF